MQVHVVIPGLGYEGKGVLIVRPVYLCIGIRDRSDLIYFAKFSSEDHAKFILSVSACFMMQLSALNSLFFNPNQFLI